MAEPIIPSREASVEVMVLKSCPEHVRERFKFARDEIYKAFRNSRLRKKLNSKTIGVMHVHFSDRSEKTIFAISGQGMDEWTMKEVKFSNIRFDGVREGLRERNVVWAPLTCEHPAYQSLQGEEIQGGQEERKAFAEEYRQRLENKAESMKRAIHTKKMTENEFKDLFIKKAEFRPEIIDDFIKHVIPLYWKISQCEQYRTMVLKAIENLMQFGEEKQFILQSIFRHTYMKMAFLEIKCRINKAEVKPDSAKDVVEKFIKPIAPKYEKVIPEFKSMPAMLCVALGYKEIPITSKLADMTVRCAEDNALECLIEIQKSRIREGYAGRVTRIDWFSANLDTLNHKPLCPFCEVAFKPRARQLVTREGDKVIYS